ncbi:MAG: holin family protein [Sterolibacterium sp.]
MPFVEKIFDTIFPDPAVATDAKLKLLELQQSGQLAELAASTDLAKGQLEINKIEAGNESLFVAGWRPFIGWVCGAAFAYNLVIQPFLMFVLAACGEPIIGLPELDTDLLGWALGGMLGLGTMRSVEKVKGVTPLPWKK